MKIGKIMIGAFAGVLLMSGCMTEEPIKQRATEERIKLIGNSSFTIELLNAKTMIKIAFNLFFSWNTSRFA